MTHHICNPDSSQLLLIDLQTRLFAVMTENQQQVILRSASVLIQGAHALGIPVIATEQYPQGLGGLDSGITQHLTGADPVFAKTGFSAMTASGLPDLLAQNNRRQLVLIGLEAHICILQSAFDLAAAGYQVFVVKEGICSRHPHNVQNAITRMEKENIVVTNVESVIFEWLRDAKHPQFKTLAKLIR